MVRNTIEDYSICAGCYACEEACPVNAISMEMDSRGFYRPHVNHDMCIGCGKCKSSCDYNSEEHIHCNDAPIAAYGIKHLDEKVRAASRSGGIFTAITDYVIDRGGCVFGAYLSNDYEVKHIKCETKAERDLLRGSKYVQSNLKNIYKEVKEQLLTGRLVVFSGTGCQVAGLKSFLKKDYENLITIDIVCHGVPSPGIWKDYVNYLRRKYGSFTNFNFRDKSILGWDMHIESYLVNGRKKISREYSSLFTDDYILRESCFECRYTNMSRPGDFTIADFWGVDNFFNQFNDNKGVSLLLVNSSKGEEIFSSINENGSITSLKCDNFNFKHRQLREPTAKPNNYETFWEDYERQGFDYILKKYGLGDKKKKLKTLKSIVIVYIKRRYLKR